MHFKSNSTRMERLTHRSRISVDFKDFARAALDKLGLLLVRHAGGDRLGETNFGLELVRAHGYGAVLGVLLAETLRKKRRQY